MKYAKNVALLFLGVGAVFLANAAKTTPPYPVITMPSSSKPLVPPPSSPVVVQKNFKAAAIPVQTAATATPMAVNMKILVLAADAGEFSYQSITTYLTEIGVPYTGIVLDTLTPDSNGNRLATLPLTDPASGRGLYQGLIFTNSTFGYCNPTCVAYISAADFTTLNSYATQYNVRIVSYYTYPEAKWGLSAADLGASYTAANPLQLTLTSAGASVFSYINSKNAIPVSGSGTGGIYAYKAAAVAAAGETTTPLLTDSSGNVFGVTHTTLNGPETLSLTMDNFPSLLHSLAFSYGVINWVTKGVFLGSRQIYISAQDDDLLFGDRLYAPTLPQCPTDPSCPDIRSTPADLDALAKWQNTKHQDPQFPHIKITYVWVGIGSQPGFAPYMDTLPAAMTAHANDFAWITHTWTHPNLDCYVTVNNVCAPATFDQSLYEIERNALYAVGLGLPADTTGLVTPFNGGLDNQAFMQASAEEGITSIITPTNPPSPGTGMFSTLAPSILLMPRRVTNLFDDVDSPSTGVYGSLPDEYNSLYGPGGSTPVFTANQTYSQIIDNESTLLLQTRMLAYEPYPLGFHTSNSIAYNGTNSLLTDLFDATFTKYEKIYNLPVTTLATMRDVAPLLIDRASYNASGVTGVYTPGVSVVLTTVNAGTIPMTGACSQANCPTYGGQIQDNFPMAAHSSVTLSLTPGVGVGLSTLTLNPTGVASYQPSQGLVTLNGPATSNVIVALSSNNSAVVVPANVTIAPGDLGAAFTVSSKSSLTASATISATYNGVTRTATLSVAPAVSVSSLSLNPATVAGGTSTTGTITLTGAAPAGGVTANLVSNNTSATLPVSVTINAGSTSATFPVTTTSAAATGGILGIYNGVTVSANLTVTTPTGLSISGVSLNPTSVTGGTSSTGTVTLTAAAPAGGALVSLSSNNANAAVPASVTVAAGATSATFTVTTKAVAVSATAIIGATYNGGTAVTTTLTLTPPAVSVSISSVSLNPTSVPGGTSSTGTVTLSGPAPAAGIVVSLSSNSPAATVPATVTVTSGNTAAGFTVATAGVTVATTAVISGTYNSVSKTASLTVTPVIAISSVSLNPTSVPGGTSSTGTVTLSGPAPAAGIVVSLSSNSPAATVPATVTVTSGNTAAGFTVATAGVTVATTAVISGTYNSVSKTASLTVTPVIAISSVSLNPTSVTGGTPSTGTVTLTAAAPVGGIMVALSSNNMAAAVPASVTIMVGAGSVTGTFTVNTMTVTSATSASITGAYNGVSKSAVLAITPPPSLSRIQVNPGSVAGGTSATATVTLTSPAGPGGVTVTLWSALSFIAAVPQSVTVPAGSSAATFTVNTAPFFFTLDVTLAAFYNGVTQNTSLTVGGLF